MPGPPPLATVSVDMDPLDLHLEGYGHRGLAPDTQVYARALPRLLELFERHRIRATFFVVARDLPDQTPVIEAIVRAGHEVASHSLTHPGGFASLPEPALDVELAESKARLERAARGPVAGFRAPNWDLTAPRLRRVRAAGYLYDASSVPSPFLFAARVAVAVKAVSAAPLLRGTKGPVLWRRDPVRVAYPEGEIVEFPVTTLGWARIPLYHTLAFFRSARSLERALDAAARQGSLFYTMHAIDVLGLREDELDPRLARHPGMGLGLAGKLDRANRALSGIASRFDAQPYRDLLCRLPLSA